MSTIEDVGHVEPIQGDGIPSLDAIVAEIDGGAAGSAAGEAASTEPELGASNAAKELGLNEIEELADMSDDPGSDAKVEEKPEEKTPEADLAAVEAEEVAKRVRAKAEAEAAKILEEARTKAAELAKPKEPETAPAPAKVGDHTKALGPNATDEQIATYYWIRKKAAEGDADAADQLREIEQQASYRSSIQSTQESTNSELQQLRMELAELRGQKIMEDWEKTIKTSEEMPFVKNWLERDPEEARDALVAEHQRLQKEYGERPAKKDVLSSLEKREKSRAERLGYTLKTEADPPAPTEAKTSAPKAPAGISRELGISTVTSSEPVDLDELEALVVSEIEAGKA